ncbi:MAG: RNA methyltransferase [Salinivirgaceae bacterium]|nr:RNA methyltransferase [Salinivirgaceae bacterium]
MISVSEIKFIKSLEIKKYRIDNQLFVVEGEKLVLELLDSNYIIKDLFATDGFSHKTKVPIRPISEKELHRISFLKTPNKILAVVEMPSFDACDSIFLDSKIGLTIGLDGVRDPGNMGTILRIANWYGIRFVFCSADCVDCYSPKVVQSSMGALFRTQVIYGDLPDFITKMKNGNQSAIFTTELGGTSIYDQEIASNSMLIFGSESHGVRPEISILSDQRLLIPSFPPNGRDMESLNVGVAVGITCAEFRRREIISGYL